MNREQWLARLHEQHVASMRRASTEEGISHLKFLSQLYGAMTKREYAGEHTAMFRRYKDGAACADEMRLRFPHLSFPDDHRGWVLERQEKAARRYARRDAYEEKQRREEK